MPFRWSQVFAVIVLVGSSILVPAVQPTGIAAAPTEARTEAALLADLPNTLVIGADAIAPKVLEVTAGQSVTLVNEDTRARTVRIADPTGGPDPTPDPTASPTTKPTLTPTTAPSVTPTIPPSTGFRVFIPLVVRSGPRVADTSSAPSTDSAVMSTVPPAVETITLRPGQRVARSFGTVGNIEVVDATNPRNSATIAVVPPALNKSGQVNGKVLDWATKRVIVGARVKALDTTLEDVSDAQGHYRLPLPPGDYTIVIYANGYTFANRKIRVQSFTSETVEPIELVPLDSKVTSVGRSGGTATNALTNTNVVFAAGAVAATKAIRLTDLPVDEFKGDFAALPGPFTDGKIPMGFVMFEPDGTHFNAPAVWTIDYEGTLPVGSDVPCYYWLEKEARWGEPVPGKVVDLGNGKKGLRATLPHFSSYGFAAPPPPEPQPPDPPPPPDPSDPPAPDDNPSAPDNGCPKGSQINLMSGELCQIIGTIALPSTGGLPSQIVAHYRSLDLDTTTVISTSFKQKANSATPDVQEWRFTIAGRTFEGTGSDVNVVWDGKDSAGHTVPPGSHEGTLTAIWTYITSTGLVRYEVPITWTVDVKRHDLSPFGRGWFSGHDALLIDRGALVTLLQGDGRQLNFAKEGTRYAAPKGETSTLVRNANGTWTRTFRNGATLSFNGDGRLARIADRYGNAQVLQYESNGRTYPAGTWGITTRIRRVTDTSNNSFDYAYDANGWLARITDSTGRVYKYQHDAGGNLTASIDPLAQRETFTYDARGMMTSHTDRRQYKTSYKLDNQGRLTSRTWPTGTILRMTFKPNEATMVTDRGTPLRTQMDDQHNPVLTYNGVYSSTTTYNADLRPETTDRPPQTTLYDQDGNVIAVAGAVSLDLERAGPFDQTTRTTASDGTDTRSTYDAKGNLTSFTDALGQRYTMTYDAHGQPLRITDPLAHTTIIGYDSRGLVTSLTDPLKRRFEMAYDARGNLTATTDPLDRTTASEYDVLGRVTALVDALKGRTTFAYDPNDNLTRVVDPTGRAIAYTYDALNRPTDVKYADGGVEKRSYDADGNLIGLLDALGRLTRWQRDAAGRMTRKTLSDGKTVTYAYDTLDQLTSVDDGTLNTTMRYQPGTSGMPVQERQLARSLPLSVTVDYNYGAGLDTIGGGVGQLTAATLDQAVQRGDEPQPTPTPPPSPTPAVTPSPPQASPTPWEPVPEPTTAPPPIPAADQANLGKAPVVHPASTSSYREAAQANTRIDVSGVINRNTTWTAANVYVVNGDVTVEKGATLTVKPGTVVKFAGYYDDLFVNGVLMAEGTAQQPIAFTGLSDDAHGGDTNGNGASVGTTDSWSAIHFATGSRGRIKHAFIGYGGGATVGMVHSVSSDVILDYVTLQQSQHYGLYTENASVRVTNSTITGNHSYGLFYNGIGANVPLVVTDNTFVSGGNQAGRLVLGAGKHNVTVQRNRTTGGRNGWSTAGTLYGTMVWDNPDALPLLVEGDLTVAPTSTLTLKPDSTVKFVGYYDDLFVNGVLMAEGTTQQPLAFTGLSDDAHGGDTNGNGASIGTTDSWSAVHFSSGSRGRIKHAFIGYGGGATVGMVHSASNNVVLDYVTLQQSQHYGIYAENAVFRVTNSNFVGNGSHAVYNATPEQAITAVKNYWDAASGPRHSTNPSGTGQTASDGVLFSPWNPAFLLPGGGRLQEMELRSNRNRPQGERYIYDSIGRMVSLSSTGYASYTLDYEYDRANRLVERRSDLKAGLATAYGYDAASQVTEITHRRTAGTTLREQYSYDATGNLTRAVSSRDGTTTYGYDQLNHLISATGPGLNMTYGYDAAGNRTKAGTVTYTYDVAGRLIRASDGTSYAYDKVGNLVSQSRAGKMTSYIWDSENQLVRINYPNGTWSGYRYDDWGRRISKRMADGTQVYYAYNGDLLLQELDSRGRVLASYTYDDVDRPMSMWRGGKTYYYVLNRLGSVLGLSDEQGGLVVTYRYDPWGNLLSSTGTVANPLRFTSREYDSESGLYFYRARYYDPNVGRFISRDPIGIAGGLNMYAYVENNPMTWSDPGGLEKRGGGYGGIEGGNDAIREYLRKQQLQKTKDIATERAAAQLAADNQRQLTSQQLERAANKPQVCDAPKTTPNPFKRPGLGPLAVIPPDLITMGAAYLYGKYLVQTGQITPQQFNNGFNARYNPPPVIY